MNSRRALLFGLPIVLALTGCDVDDMGSWGSSDRFKEDFHYSYKLKPGGRLELSNFNGGVEIIAWEKDDVEVHGVKYASSEDVLRQMKIEADSQPESLRLKTVRPEGLRCNCGAKYVLRVPKKVWLSNIVSSNGGIKVEDVEGEARLESSNGSVKLYRHTGKVSVKTSNASIEAMSLNGDFSGRTSNGHVKVEGLKGAFEADTSNASIVARIEQLPPGRPVKADSSNGGIELYLSNFTDQPIEADTSNSSITLRLPASAGAELRASTTNGSISNDFELTSTGENSKRRVEGRIGTGGPLVRLSTSNGGIRVQKL
jgi:DUF4097 and DUF4098 domain-containing protein YvlB